MDFLVWGSGKNSRITAAEQRNISDMSLPFGQFNAGSCTLFVLIGAEVKGGCKRSGSGDTCVVAFARAEEGGDDTVQGAQFLLGALGALKQVAQIAGHAGALVGVAQKAAQNERLLEMIEEAQQLGLLGRAAVAGVQELGGGLGLGDEPLIADEQDRLRQVERGEGGVERHGHDG